MRLIILLITLLPACSHFEPTPGIHEDFMVYTEEFEHLNGAKLPSITINYGRPSIIGMIGTCTRYSNGRKVITIDKELWDMTCIYQKRSVIFHELGHCVLNRHHTPNFYSHMYFMVNSCLFYEENEDQLDAELFN